MCVLQELEGSWIFSSALMLEVCTEVYTENFLPKTFHCKLFRKHASEPTRHYLMRMSEFEIRGITMPADYKIRSSLRVATVVCKAMCKAMCKAVCIAVWTAVKCHHEGLRNRESRFDSALFLHCSLLVAGLWQRFRRAKLRRQPNSKPDGKLMVNLMETWQ